MTSLITHRRRFTLISGKGPTSKTSGRYQQMLKDWPHCAPSSNCWTSARSEQDVLALRHIRECRALLDVHAGRIETAICKCRNIWASLPGAGYGQREHRLEDLIKQYRLAGGVLS